VTAQINTWQQQNSTTLNLHISIPLLQPKQHQETSSPPAAKMFLKQALNVRNDEI